MATGNLAEQIDTAIANFFASWNSATIIFATILLVVLLYPLFTGREPDTHPFLLARQAVASPIRQPGESAVYRSSEIPYGYPLRSGLGIKDPGAPKWSAGRNGDLRDVWRQAVRGPVKDDGSSNGPKGKIMTVLGREKVIDHDLASLTVHINIIGKYLQQNGSKRVAVCLPNSVELLCSVFAGAFYNFSPVLIPYGLDMDKARDLLSEVKADTVIAEVGTFPLSSIMSTDSTIRRIIWVSQGGSRHLDWDEIPEGTGGQIDVSTWHDMVEDKNASTEIPPVDKETKTLPIFAFWPTGSDNYELFEYSPECIISAISGLSASLPRNHKLNSSDILVPTLSLTQTYPLCWTFAALFANASIALNSVAGDSVNLTLAAHGAHPTIIIASSTAISQQQADLASSAPSGIASTVSTYMQKQSLASGTMPAKTATTVSASPFGNLRLLLISQRGRDTSPVPSTVLGHLRLRLGARIGYALVAGPIAGAVCQTNILDYRDKGDMICVGPPLSSVEVHLSGAESELDTHHPRGKIAVKGPAVVGRQVLLDLEGQVDVDNTIFLA